MAVNTTPIETKLKLRFNCGTDDEGKDIMKNRTYSKIRVDAADEDIHTVAQTLGGLQKHSMEGIIKIEESKLVEA